MNAITTACVFVGGQVAMAALIGVTPQAINQWVKTGRVPAERCRAIEAATGVQVTRYDLRPDVFGENPQPETQQEAA